MISKGDKFFDTFDTPHNHCAMVHHCKNSIGVIVQGQVKNLKVQVLGPLEKPEILAVKELLVFSSWFSVPGFWFLVYGFRFLVFDFDTPHSHSGMELVIQYSRLFTSRHKSRSF